MDILVISDSHGRTDRIEELLSRDISPSAIFFLGDCLRDIAWIDTKGVPVYAVHGNCDMIVNTDTEEILTELGGKRIFASHGHKYSVKRDYDRMVERAVALGADIMLFGHTHVPLTKTLTEGERIGEVTLQKKLHILNPGSIGYDRSFGVVVIHGREIITSVGEI